MFKGRSRVSLRVPIQRGLVDRDMCGAAIAVFAVLAAAPGWAQCSAPRFVAAWGQEATPDGQLDPRGIAADAQGNVYVIDRYEVESDEQARTDEQVETDEPVQTDEPDAKKEERFRIRRFTSGGEFLLEWGDFDGGDRHFRLPTGVFVDAEGYVYTSDGHTEQVQKFTPEGELLARFGAKGALDGQSK